MEQILKIYTFMMIGIPLAIQQCGLVMGILVFALVAFLIFQSVTLMVECGVQRRVYNLEDLAEVSLGSIGYYVSTISMIIFACGGQTAYLVIIGDTVPSVAHFFSDDNVFTNRAFSLSVFATFIILPICLSRDLGHLAWTSLVSNVLEVVLLVVIAFASIRQHSEHAETGFQPSDVRDVNSSLFAGVGTMSFALVCQHNSFLLFQSLKSPNMSNWKQVAAQSISFGFLISLLFGLVGFVAFYPNVSGDILNNFPVGSRVIGVGRGVLAAIMLLTYPMELYVSRHCLTSLIHRWRLYHSVRSKNRIGHVILPNIMGEDQSGNIELQVQTYSTLHPPPTTPSTTPGINHLDERHNQVDKVHFAPTFTSLARKERYAYNKLENQQHNLEEISFNSHENRFSDIEQMGTSELPIRQDVLIVDDSSEFEEIVFTTDPGQQVGHHNVSQIGSGIDAKLDVDTGSPVVHSASSSSIVEHVLLTVGIWLVTLIIALSARELGVVSALTGTIAASTLGYTLPALIFFFCHAEELRILQEYLRSLITTSEEETASLRLMEDISIWKLIRMFSLPSILFVFGIATFLIGVTTVLLSV